jgi:hypothetical protein
MANLTPTNEEFIDSSYNNDPRLSQPSSGVRQVRNVQTDKRYDPNKRRGSAVDRAASTFGESRQADKINGQEDQKRTQAEGIRSVATAQYQSAGQRAVQTSRSTMSAGGKGLKSVGGKLFGRSVTLGIWSWGFFIWLWFQVPITIVSILFMALTEAIYQLSLSLTVSAEADGLAVTAAKHVVSFTAATINSVAGLVNAVIKEMFGFTLAVFNPTNAFMLTHLLLVFVGWGMLLVIGIIYTMTGQKAFSGEGAAGKNGMFLIALIGYTIPIFNILPLFFFWTLMVLKNPR